MSLGHPGDYPWSEPSATGTLYADRLLPGPAPAEVLRGRAAVVAVGSNASPTVLRRKLGRLLDAGLPVASGWVSGLAVGHSAHVSVRGYVPAAPVAHEGVRTEVGLAWCTPAQLEVLDATEPNYQRIAVGLACTTDDGRVVDRPYVYDSRHGVLADAGAPLAFLTQVEVLGWLAERVPSLARALAPGTAPYDALADPEVRDRVLDELAAAGLARPSGLA